MWPTIKNSPLHAIALQHDLPPEVVSKPYVEKWSVIDEHEQYQGCVKVVRIDDFGGNELHVGSGELVDDGSGEQDETEADATEMVGDVYFAADFEAANPKKITPVIK